MNDPHASFVGRQGEHRSRRPQISRRSFLDRAALTAGLALLNQSTQELAAETGEQGPISPNDSIKVTKIETFVLKNSWVFVKISTDAGITGWGEMLKDDAKACAAGALEVSDYLIGKDPRPVVHHWQAIHRGAFYRGGPIKTAISSGIDQALWDITGKCYGVPVYKLLGGPTRDRVRVYGVPDKKTGVNAMKVGPWTTRKAFKYIEGQKFVDEVVERFAALEGRVSRSRHWPRFPRSGSAHHGNPADQGSRTTASLVLRGGGAGPERGRDG